LPWMGRARRSRWATMRGALRACSESSKRSRALRPGGPYCAGGHRGI
jgi:hypothetical protein